MNDRRLVPIKNEVAERLHWTLNKALQPLPLATRLGRVVGLDELSLGFPGGSHRSAPFWRFEPVRSPVIFHFGFVPNFSWDDLMCKVSPAGLPPAVGTGASVQLNGLKSFLVEGEFIAVAHSGSVTLGHALSRETLAADMTRLAPDVVAHFGGLQERWWPLALGSTASIPDLVDNLFLWSSGVEQVKRAHREESQLDLSTGLPT